MSSSLFMLGFCLPSSCAGLVYAFPVTDGSSVLFYYRQLLPLAFKLFLLFQVDPRALVAVVCNKDKQFTGDYFTVSIVCTCGFLMRVENCT